ncbi:MAG: MFS transporter [Micromonosporaceae bacterium]
MAEKTSQPPGADSPARGFHWAWVIAAVSFVVLLSAAAFRSAPSVLIEPLHTEYGWSRAVIGSAVSVNLVLFGLISPFAAALMERWGLRRVAAGALLLISAGSGLTIFMTASWQLIVCWGVLVGVGAGSISMVFVAAVVSRWFVAKRGLVTGVLTAAAATGQLVFLPSVAYLAESYGWRAASLAVSLSALAVSPLAALLLRDHPRDVGLAAYGATDDAAPSASTATGSGAAARALSALAGAVRTRAFWLLAGGFAICGISTNGLVGTHFVPAAHDHGMPLTTGAGLLALVGVFDIAGTVLSGWLTDRIRPQLLLGAYYSLRGASLLVLPLLFAPHVQPSMWVFIVFYGLDWIATVPPTVALCRDWFGASGPVVFGWVFASHQIGAAVAAVGAGAIRDAFGAYHLAWYVAGGLCVAAAAMSLRIGRAPHPAAV